LVTSDFRCKKKGKEMGTEKEKVAEKGTEKGKAIR